MGRPSQKKKADISLALVELRRRLGMTQQQMAVRAGLAMQTVSKYEAKPPLYGAALEVFEKVAEEEGHFDLSMVFNQAQQRTSGEELQRMVEHFATQRDAVDHIKQSETHLWRRMEVIADPGLTDEGREQLRNELKQLFLDYAKNWRAYSFREVQREREKRMNA